MGGLLLNSRLYYEIAMLWVHIPHLYTLPMTDYAGIFESLKQQRENKRMLREMRDLFNGDDDDEQPRGRQRRQYEQPGRRGNNTRNNNNNGNDGGQPRQLIDRCILEPKACRQAYILANILECESPPDSLYSERISRKTWTGQIAHPS